MTEDNEVVAINDETVDRTTNGEGRVDQLDLEEVQRLEVASDGDYPETRGNSEDLRVPTLEDIFDYTQEIPAEKRPESIILDVKDEETIRKADEIVESHPASSYLENAGVI